MPKSQKALTHKFKEKPVSKHSSAARPTSDMVTRAAQVMIYDAMRSEIWQVNHRGDAPTMQFAYGHMIREFLDEYEKFNGALLSDLIPRPVV